MHYQKYIELGFERYELNDEVLLKQTGYTGFTLEKKISKKIKIFVSCGELDRPKIQYKKGKDDFVIFEIKPITVIQLTK